VSRPTRGYGFRCPVRGCHPLRPAFPGASGTKNPYHWPRPLSLATTHGVSLMSFPPATEMFQFAGFASRTYGFSPGYRQSRPGRWVAPFGDPGIADRSHLPPAFRSVLRPSSPLSAKASTRCPYLALLYSASNNKHHRESPLAPKRTRPGERCPGLDPGPLRPVSNGAPDPIRGPCIRRQNPRTHNAPSLPEEPSPEAATLLLPRRHFPADTPRAEPGTRPSRRNPLPRARRRLPPRSRHNSSLHPSINKPATDRSPSRMALHAEFPAPQRAPRHRPVPLRLVPPTGGGERDRTDDLLLAKQALSQLSYTPCAGTRSHGSGARHFLVPRLVPEWWAREDLNLRPHAYQARALTS